MKKKYEIVIGGSIATAIFLGSTPAFAEGTWTSYLSKVGVGFSSRSWIDNALDNNPTTIKLAGCSLETAGVFKSATINLYREFGIFPDQSKGSIVNKCTITDWGQALEGDSYHFTIEGINESGSQIPRMNATSLVTKY
jgi:hypothetical protein